MKNSKILKILALLLLTGLIYLPAIIFTGPVMRTILYSGNDSDNYFVAHLVHGLLITIIVYFSVGFFCKSIFKDESIKFKSLVILLVILIERLAMLFLGIQIYILSGGDIQHAAQFPEMEGGHFHIFPFFTWIYILIMPILDFGIAYLVANYGSEANIKIKVGRNE